MTIHMGVQRKVHRFAYITVQIILCFVSYFFQAIPSLYFSSLSPAETTSEAYCLLADAWKST